VEIPFAGEHSDPAEPEQDLESFENALSGTEERQVVQEQPVGYVEDSTLDEEVFSPSEGIVEIPIEKPKVNGER